MNPLLLLSGCSAAGFLLGLAVTCLYFRRRAGSFERLLRAWDHRKHSMRAANKRFKVLKRPRYRIDARQFRFSPRNTRGW